MNSPATADFIKVDPEAVSVFEKNTATGIVGSIDIAIIFRTRPETDKNERL